MKATQDSGYHPTALIWLSPTVPIPGPTPASTHIFGYTTVTARLNSAQLRAAAQPVAGLFTGWHGARTEIRYMALTMPTAVKAGVAAWMSTLDRGERSLIRRHSPPPQQ